MTDNSELGVKLNKLFESVTDMCEAALQGKPYDNDALKSAMTFLKNNDIKLDNLPETANTGEKAPKPTVPFRIAVGE